MQHPDEGTIHAWLDGALGSDEARSLEAHVAGCAQCAEAVSEARGLLAASSRILSALDSVPGGVLPAIEPEAASDERVIPIGGRSLWRSPGWRAAAAIVLVGSVSWLATRSVHRADERSPASRAERAGAAVADSRVTASAPAAVADTTTQVAPRAVTPSRPQVALGIAPGHGERLDAAGMAAREDAPAASSARAAKTAAPLAAPPQVAAAPQAMAFATTRPAGAPNVGTVGGGAGAQGKLAASVLSAPIASAPGAPAPAASNQAGGTAARQEEARVADAGIRVRGAAAAQSRMKSSAPGATTEALSLMQLSGADPAAKRLAGCYYIEIAGSQADLPEIRSAAGLVPAQVELMADRDTAAGGIWRILRPAPGAQPFRLAAQARWLMLTADSVKLELREGLRSVSARLGVRGDSIRGRAMISDPQLPTGGMAADVRGSRMLCSSP